MIYIVGAGAIGQALAVCLQRAGKTVTLVRRNAGQSKLKIRLKIGEESLEETVPVTSLERGGDGLVLVTAKSFANPEIAARLTTRTIILLQNGLNIERTFKNKQLYRCVLLVTSQFDADGTIIFKPVSSCPVGLINGDKKLSTAVIEQLNNPWFRFHLEKDIQPLIWKKAIVNCVFNSICPLLETDNGIFHRDQSARTIALKVVAECLSVAHRYVKLELDEVMDSLLNISKLSDGQLISTLQDIRMGRPTELDTLNAEFVRLAGDLPLPETRLLGELTTLKSKINHK